MELKDLSVDQKIQLKQSILVERQERTFYSELVEADELVTDEELEERFGSTSFVEDDFFLQ